jgi:hypothetical protein
MAAKKTNPITYLGNPSTIIQPIGVQIPNYEDSGVRFQGWAKKDKGNNQFELKKQVRVIYNAKITHSNVSVPFTINRSNSTKFYCTAVIIETDSPMNYLDIYDGVYNTSNAKIYLKMSGTNPTRYDKEIYFDIPLEFSGNILLYQTAVWGVDNYLTITFYGWEESNI